MSENKEYPLGKYKIVWLQGNFWKRFKKGKGMGYWRHPDIPLGVFAKWTLRICFVEIQQWLSESEPRG